MYSKVALRRCLELYREGGVRELSRGIRDYIQHDLGSNYKDRRTDNDYRWEFIASHIDDDVQTLVDIGCAEGEFSARAADLGLDVIGFDRNVIRIHKARSEYGNYENLRFERSDLDPESIDDIPEADVILFLTVHHHWVEAYGWDKAEEMFRTVFTKGDIIVYEPPGHIPIGESVEGSLDPEESVDYYRDVIESTFGTMVSIVDVTLTGYITDSDRNDPVFVIDSSDYPRG